MKKTTVTIEIESGSDWQQELLETYLGRVRAGFLVPRENSHIKNKVDFTIVTKDK